MIRYYNQTNQNLNACEPDSADIFIFLNPNDEEKQALYQDYDIDVHTLSSALDPDEVSRIEIEGTNTTIIWKQPKHYSAEENISFGVSSIGFFIIKDKLIIISSEDVSLSEVKPSSKFRNPMDVALYIINTTIRHYLEHLKIIKMISHELQVKINASMENEHLIQMFSLSESLIYYYNAISSNNLALHKLKNYASKLSLSEETVEFLDDIIIENNQCFRQAEIYSNVLSGLMDARGTLVNNNMNVLMKNLTIINVIFLPLNLIASIGGMSEYSMMTAGIPWEISYLLFAVVMVIAGWFTAIMLKRMKPFKKNTVKRKQKIFKTFNFLSRT